MNYEDSGVNLCLWCYFKCINIKWGMGIIICGIFLGLDDMFV